MDLLLQPKQTEAYISKATELLYGGAAGGGKSHLMRVGAIAWCTDIPGIQVYIFRRLSDDLTKNHLEGPTGFRNMLSEWVDAGFVKINESKHEIQFWNGSKIFLCHCQYEKDRFKYQGAEIHVLMIDELTHFTETIYRYLRGRCRLGALVIPDKYRGKFPLVLCGSNPGGTGHNWVKASWIDIAPPMQITRMPKEEGGMLRQYIPAKLSDNKKLSETDPDYESRLEGLGNPALVRAMRDGDWDIVAGGAIDDLWSREKHIIHHFRIPDTWYVNRSFDWGSSKPFAVCWWAESDGTEATMSDGKKRSWPRGTLFLVGEWYGWNGRPNEGLKYTSEEMGKGIAEREKSLAQLLGVSQIRPGPADSAIFAENEGDTPANKIDKGYGRKGCFKPSDKSPGSRKRGLELLRTRLKASLQSPQESPGIFVFDTCTQFIRTVPVLPRDLRDPDDVDSDAEDHIYDAVRYRLTEKRIRSGVVPVGGA